MEKLARLMLWIHSLRGIPACTIKACQQSLPHPIKEGYINFINFPIRQHLLEGEGPLATPCICLFFIIIIIIIVYSQEPDILLFVYVANKQTNKQKSLS